MVNVNGTDPRVKRTHQLLLQAFADVLEEKRNIHPITISDITARAAVNRATFYSHFEDKYALLDIWIREKFQRLLAKQLPASSGLNLASLQILIQTVFDFLAGVRNRIRPPDRQFEPLFETALQQELQRILLTWLQQDSTARTRSEQALEMAAIGTSWAIFGAAAQWSRGSRTQSAEEMSRAVLTVVIGGLSGLTSSLALAIRPPLSAMPSGD